MHIVVAFASNTYQKNLQPALHPDTTERKKVLTRAQAAVSAK